jgi:hypothetical protein
VGEGDAPDFSLLPGELQPLARLITKYGVADDVVRGALVGEATDAELRELHDAASPHWAAINTYLDENLSPPGPRQDVAVALGDFAQAAMEARFELERSAT